MFSDASIATKCVLFASPTGDWYMATLMWTQRQNLLVEPNRMQFHDRVVGTGDVIRVALPTSSHWRRRR